MATNIAYDKGGVRLRLDLGGAVVAGVLGKLNDLVYYTLTDTDTDNIATVILPGIDLVLNLSVLGADNVGNAAISEGDTIYDDSGTYNVDAANGLKRGYALEPVASGATTTIMVAISQEAA